MQMRALLLLMAAAGCADSTAAEPEPVQSITLLLIASGLDSPVHLTAPAGDPRLFVTEQAGTIRIIRKEQLLASPFLDIRSRVGAGGERGLLSIAFHPQYQDNGLFFVSYTDRAGNNRIERFRVSADPDAADPSSGQLILSVDQPFANHNGGLILFGPDGYLYAGLGDGGSGGDPLGHGQNRNTLLGALLRLDVDGAEPYGIPPGNPFANGGGRPELWAIGLRNPWRFAFDGGTLFVADVGQNQWEEINAAPAAAAGVNYGWKVMEGTHCFQGTGCSQGGLTLPVHEYPHAQGCSVTGGMVYRGTAIPSAQGHYFYSDFCAGWLRSFRLVDGEAGDHREWPVGTLSQVTSFGTDAAGELYILTGNGQVRRLAPAE